MNDEECAGTGGGTAEGEGKSALAPPKGDYPSGYWPSWNAKLVNDFRSSKKAKANDGLRSPKFDNPQWTGSAGANTAVILEAVRRRHEQAAERVTVAEARAHRVGQTGLTLLTVAFVVAGFSANRLRVGDAPWPTWLVVLAATILPIVLLAVAIVQAFSVDRVGYTSPAQPGTAAVLDSEPEQRQDLVRQEALAAEMANWTARHKVNEFLQARAWLTRSIAALMISGIVASLVWLLC